MKIALFSDIHANLPALMAVLEDMEARSIDQIYCLGDLVSYAPFPNEVIAEIRKRHIPCIAGNHDERIGFDSELDDYDLKLKEAKKDSAISRAFTNKMLLPKHRSYLRQLPRHLKLDFQFGEEQFSILLVHGSSKRIDEYIFEDIPEAELLDLLDFGQADIMAFGHTHKPFHRLLKDQNNRNRHAINIGSVGKPKDGDSRACYVLLDIDTHSSMNDPESIKATFIRVPYPVEAVAKAIEESPLPDIYADMLRKAY